MTGATIRNLTGLIATLGLTQPVFAQRSPPGTLLPPGVFSTSGSQIVSSDGHPVRLACVGWNQIYEGIPLLRQTTMMVADGFNCIRVSWINATMKHDLDVIDRIVGAAGKVGLRLVLDNHTNEPGHGERDAFGAQQKNGLWYDLGGASDGTDGGGNRGTTTDAKFLADWEAVARHYAGNHTVIAYDLRNEPSASVWGDGSDRDIRAMYIRVGNAIQAIDPDKLIVVEPPGGDCRGVRDNPVTLDVPSKLVYSVHEYPGEISGETVSAGPELIVRMETMWGWLINENLAPVFIGAMGSSMISEESKAWAATIVPYLNGGSLVALQISAGGQGVSTDWWAWGNLPGQNPDGTLESNWTTPRSEQEAVYSQLRPRPLPDQ